MELLGIPHRMVIGARALADGAVEYQGRGDAQAQRVPLEQAAQFLRQRLGHPV